MTNARLAGPRLDTRGEGVAAGQRSHDRELVGACSGTPNRIKFRGDNLVCFDTVPGGGTVMRSTRVVPPRLRPRSLGAWTTMLVDMQGPEKPGAKKKTVSQQVM
jgi:hypothetical protein